MPLLLSLLVGTSPCTLGDLPATSWSTNRDRFHMALKRAAARPAHLVLYLPTARLRSMHPVCGWPSRARLQQGRVGPNEVRACVGSERCPAGEGRPALCGGGIGSVDGRTPGGHSSSSSRLEHPHLLMPAATLLWLVADDAACFSLRLDVHPARSRPDCVGTTAPVLRRGGPLASSCLKALVVPPASHGWEKSRKAR